MDDILNGQLSIVNSCYMLTSLLPIAYSSIFVAKNTF